MKKLIFLNLILGPFCIFGQVKFKEYKTQKLPEHYQKVRNCKSYKLDKQTLSKSISENNLVTLPNASGEPEQFLVEESNTMSAELQVKFPNIRSYKGTSTSDPHTTLRLDINIKGIYVWIKKHGGSYFISSVNDEGVVAFSENEYKKANRKKYAELQPRPKDEAEVFGEKRKLARKSNSGTLRTYRLAVSCTGEYAQYHGGTKATALSAITTTINRVNEVYENEFSVHFDLVPNMEDILFTNASTDPYTDDNADQLIDQVQIQIDNIIGTANYDIGHVFSTGGGGLAQIAAVCGQFKANGVTGSSNPIGDPYDIDFVAHEFGHQFGAEHTFNSNENSCDGTGWSQTSFEPGSGTTIMAYAGICAPHNIQENSDDYFHVASVEEIVEFITEGNGNTCGTKTSINNTAPTVSVEQGGFTIPISTPFKLSGSAIDAEDKELTYCWEQYDLGPFGAPNNPSGNAPIFRSFQPTSEPTRYFPNLNSIRNGTSTFGELLPTYSRDLTFQLTVRDNHAGGGGINSEKIAFKADAAAGPFVVTSQNSSQTYSVNQQVAVTWNVANTNQAPINCAKVNVLLSTDGGVTFPTTLASETENDGSVMVTIPNLTTSKARIIVEAADNIFFNMNSTNFTIQEPTTPDYALNLTPDYLEQCPPISFEIDVDVTRFSGFNEAITVSVSGEIINRFDVAYENDNQQVPTTLIFTPKAGEFGEFSGSIDATSTSINRSKKLTLRSHESTNPSVGELFSPEDGATGESIKPTFQWRDFVDVDQYIIEVADNPAFTDAEVINGNSTNELLYPNALNSSSTYYWRVKGINNCGESSFTSAFSFTTGGKICETYSNTTSVSLPNNQSSFSSFIQVPVTGLVAELNVKSIKGTHEYTDDLSFFLVAPSGENVELLSDVCSGGNGRNFDFGLDDESANGTPPCPPTTGNTYTSKDPLSSLNGEEAQGSWELNILDNFPDIDQGTLQSWELEVCTIEGVTGVNNEIVPAVFVLPNPANSTIQINSSADVKQVLIYNTMGQEVMTSTKSQLNIENLESGVYTYVVVSGENKVRGNFVKL